MQFGIMGEGKVTQEFTVVMSRVELLAKVQTNAKAHTEAFQKAHAAYIEALKKHYLNVLESITDGHYDYSKAIFREPIPESHDKDYKRVIAMLQADTRDTIEISEDNFNQYVMDEWGWKAAFTASLTNYGV